MRRVWVPRPDQEAVMRWLDDRRRAAIWSGGGSGKTVMALTWLAEWMLDRFEVARALIVAPPLPARDGWPEQMALWEHLSGLPEPRVLGASDFGLTLAQAVEIEVNTPQGVVVRRSRVPRKAPIRPATPFLGEGEGGGSSPTQNNRSHGGLIFADKAGTKRRLQAMREPVHIVPWTFWPWLVQAYGANFPYDAVVFDEASFLRDEGSERHRAARHALRRVNRPPTHVLELTASPGANRDEAVRSQLDLLQPGVMGETLTAFRDEWCVPDRKNWQTGMVYSWKIATNAYDRYEKVVKQLAVSVPSRLASELVHVEHWVTLPEEAMRADRALRDAGVWQDIVCGSAAVVHSKRRQVAAGFVYRGPDVHGEESTPAVPLHSVKLDKLEDLIESIDAPVLIAYDFRHEQEMVAARLGKAFADIRQPGAKQRFVDGKLRALGLNPASAGHGVDGLQHVCCNIIWLTPTVDRELFDQTNWRVHRTGTTAPTVWCHAILARDTEDERTWGDVLPAKGARQDRLLDAVSLAPPCVRGLTGGV